MDEPNGVKSLENWSNILLIKNFLYFIFKSHEFIFEKTKKQNETLDPNSATEQTVSNTEDLLPREPCLQALAALRHAKWFQVCFCFFLTKQKSVTKFFSFIQNLKKKVNFLLRKLMENMLLRIYDRKMHYNFFLV